MAACRFLENAIIVGGGQEPLSSGEATRVADLNAFVVLQRLGGPIRGSLRRQLRTAFGTAALEHEAAGLRSHPCTETMGSGALQCAGLISAFHGP